MEAVCSFETLVLTYQTVQCYNPDDQISVLKVEAVCSSVRLYRGYTYLELFPSP